MAEIFERVVAKLGWSTFYHIVWVRHLDEGGTQIGSSIWKVRPWLTRENLKIIRWSIGHDRGVIEQQVIITSITRL